MKKPLPAYEYAVGHEPPTAALDVNVIAGFLDRVIATDPRNTLPEGDNLTIWDRPVVGIASARDPLFAELKKPGVVGPVHWSPEEWLPGAKTVIAYFLPYTAEVRKTYPRQSFMPSLEWVSGRRNGETFNNVVRRALIRFLELYGGEGRAPSHDRRYRAIDQVPMWSERHAAFIAGVGTFGIHGGLITRKGVAGRIGSVITDLAIAPIPRPYTHIYGYCPYPHNGKCGACIPRCPVGAIGETSRDNGLCLKHGRDTVGAHYRDWGYHSCGHCLTWLPCADRIPSSLLPGAFPE